MGSPILLVDDDLATIAAAKRVLEGQGYEVVLASSAADAVIAWSHHLPSLLVVSPDVEGGRGRVVLEELAQHPDARLLRVLLLGESIPGFSYPVAPLPIETEVFARLVNLAARGGEMSPAVTERLPQLEAQLHAEAEAHAVQSVEAALAARGVVTPSNLTDRARDVAEQAVLAARAAGEADRESSARAARDAELTTAALAQEREDRSRLELEVAALRQQLAEEAAKLDHEVRARSEQWHADEGQLRQALETETAAARAAEATVSEMKAEFVGVTHALQQALERAAGVEDILGREMTARRQAQQELSAKTAKLAELEQSVAQLREELSASVQALASGRADVTALQERAQELLFDKDTLEQRLAQAQEALRVQVQAVQQAKQAANDELQANAQRLSDVATGAVEATKRVEFLETEVKRLEELLVRSPLQRSAPVFHAQVVPETLAKVVMEAAWSREVIELDFESDDGRRCVWMQRGEVLAATSSVPADSLLDRARLDLLIDPALAAQLQFLRTADPKETFTALMQRGLLPADDSLRLRQRFVEAVALEAFGRSGVNLSARFDAVSDAAIQTPAVRPAVAILFESLKRSSSVRDDALSALLATTVPYPGSVEVDPRELALTARERKLLSAVDAKANLEALAQTAGMSLADVRRTMAAWQAMRVVRLHEAPAETTSFAAGSLSRLAHKYEQTQEADYFTLLGLPRTAGADEIRRSVEELSDEFHPVKFAGYPDGWVHRQASIVLESLQEAARVLGDEGLRRNYARHLGAVPAAEPRSS